MEALSYTWVEDGRGEMEEGSNCPCISVFPLNE
jgi:hypothetical protein